MSPVTEEEGRLAVGLARRTLESALAEPYGPELLGEKGVEDLPPLFKEKRGLFVTLLSYPDKDLRGCIGFTKAVYPLYDGIPRAAWLAANEDYRFPPVTQGEVREIVIELSLLSPLDPIAYRTSQDLMSAIKIGRDGLVVAEGGTSGLLLPQVPVDEGWDVRDFLDGVCMKAGLPASEWTRPGPVFWKFSCQIFSEEKPGGQVAERPLTAPEKKEGRTR